MFFIYSCKKTNAALRKDLRKGLRNICPQRPPQIPSTRGDSPPRSWSAAVHVKPPQREGLYEGICESLCEGRCEGLYEDLLEG